MGIDRARRHLGLLAAAAMTALNDALRDLGEKLQEFSDEVAAEADHHKPWELRRSRFHPRSRGVRSGARTRRGF